MKPKRILFACLVLALIAAACTSMPMTGLVETTGLIENSSQTEKTPTVKLTITLTSTTLEIPTVEPMVTPSPGPAPDLEIFNVTFAPSPDNMAFLAEMRNNTDQPMIFPGRLNALRLGVEFWYQYGIYYFQGTIDAYLRPHPDINRMNCIIYPRETGIIATDFTYCEDTDDCVEKHSTSDVPPPQLGYRLINYEAYPKRWEDFLKFPYIKSNYPSELDKGYHLKVDNLTYETQVIEEQMDWGVMFFKFDVTYYQPVYQRASHAPIWIILYDKEGRIVNVMRNSWVDFCRTSGCAKSGTSYHISGAACNRTYCLWEDWKKKNPDIQWFEPIAKLTIDEMDRVDHFRILAENQDVNICINTDFDRR
jgi:hypothetical protein